MVLWLNFVPRYDDQNYDPTFSFQGFIITKQPLQLQPPPKQPRPQPSPFQPLKCFTIRITIHHYPTCSLNDSCLIMQWRKEHWHLMTEQSRPLKCFTIRITIHHYPTYNLNDSCLIMQWTKRPLAWYIMSLWWQRNQGLSDASPFAPPSIIIPSTALTIRIQ